MAYNGNSMEVDPETGFLTPSKNYKDTGFTIDQKKLSLEMLKEKFNVGKVCKAIGVNRSHFFLVLQHDPAFAKAYREIKEMHLDDIAETMYDRAKKPNGTLPGIFLLKTQRRKEYGDITVISHESKIPVDQLLSRLEESGELINAEEVKPPIVGSQISKDKMIENE